VAEAKREGMLNDAPGAAVWGIPVTGLERTPPVRRPERREARWVGAGAEVMVIRGNGQRAVVEDGWWGDADDEGQRVGDGESDKGTRWEIQTVVDQVRAADRRQRGQEERPTLRPNGGWAEVLMKKGNVWMKPRETHSVEESVGGSWRKSRYYRTDASGRDSDGRHDLG
jgi:hypothetical protein